MSLFISMASHNKNYMLSLYFVSLIFQQHFCLISASRMLNVLPPAPVPNLNSPKNFGLISASERPNIHPPAPLRALKSLKPPESHGIIVNQYKKIQSDAFRPTTPGPSQGMGHDGPPGVH